MRDDRQEFGRSMVSIECLAAFDLLIWLGTGEKAGALLRANQSTVCRYSKKCQEVFNVSMIKHGERWLIQRDDRLLVAERRVHQKYRWSHGLALRVDVDPSLLRSLPAEAQACTYAFHDCGRPKASDREELLKQHIVDLWLAPSAHFGNADGTACVPCSPSGPALIVLNEFAGHPRTVGLMEQIRQCRLQPDFSPIARV